MQTRSDDLIRSDVLFELKWDPKIGSSGDIAVAVKDGVVTLSGFTHSYWDKDAAEQAAKRVYGVRGVANDIEVKPSSKRTDPEIARDAVHELESHVSLPRDKIKVTVKNGWVTLEGNVDLAMAAIRQIRPRRLAPQPIRVHVRLELLSLLKKAAKRAHPTPKTGEQSTLASLDFGTRIVMRRFVLG